MSGRPNDAGFTVLELLVALTLLSLVIVTLISALDGARRVFDNINDSDQRLGETAIVRRLLTEALSQIARRSATGKTANLVGDERGLTVVAPGPRVLAAASPVLLSIGPGSDGTGLLASWNPEGDNAAASWPTRRIVAAGRQARFGYFTPDIGWSQAWDAAERLPRLVRVEIGDVAGLAAGAALVFAVRQVAPVRCDQQSADKRCVMLQ